jgi:CRISPR-associated protein Cas1
MYAFRLGEVLPHRDVAVLRGIEGARMKESYRLVADRFGVPWRGRRYDRENPTAADLPNQALNHAASAVEAAAAIAVAATATIPQLGFIHEESGQSFVLDVADLVRDTVTIVCAFKASALVSKRPGEGIERVTRRIVGERLRRDGVIPMLIDRIKLLLNEADDGLPAPKSQAAVAARVAHVEISAAPHKNPEGVSVAEQMEESPYADDRHRDA